MDEAQQGLAAFREEIDRVDAQMIALLEKRMGLVRQVAEYKERHQLAVLQRGREEEVLEKAASQVRDPGLAEPARELMRKLMALSRAWQAERRGKEIPVKEFSLTDTDVIGYQGVPGSFSEEALIQFFGQNAPRRAYTQFAGVFEALRQRKITYGVLPLENSSTGAVAAVYDLLRVSGCEIVGELCLPVAQNLLTLPGVTLSDIRRVYSHEQGLAQCAGFLKDYPGWERIPQPNTAGSALRVSQEGDRAQAAIASVGAAKQYGLEVLVPSIQDCQDNTTRFIIVSPEARMVEGADKVSLMLSLPDRPGALCEVLRCFAEYGVNMVKIESRPRREGPWRYIFYVDCQGEVRGQAMEQALAALRRRAEECVVLGAYRAAAQVTP